MIILASQSEARRRLLTQAAVTFTTMNPIFDETSLKSQHQNPTDLAQILATAKSLSLRSQHPDTLIIGADQTLCCGEVLLSKPGNHAAARQQLQHLRGRKHTLASAVTVSKNGDKMFEYCDTASLVMRNFSDAYLEHYIATAGPDILHCVGSYQIESHGINLFSHIQGDLFTIQGLPLLPLLAFLREVGELPS